MICFRWFYLNKYRTFNCNYLICNYALMMKMDISISVKKQIPWTD